MAERRKKQDLALINPEVPQLKVTIAGLVAKLLLHGPARADDEIIAYIDRHFDWSTIASVQQMIYQAKWAYIERVLHSTTTITV